MRRGVGPLFVVGLVVAAVAVVGTVAFGWEFADSPPFAVGIAVGAALLAGGRHLVD